MPQPVAKPQPTLTGYSAWAFDLLVRRSGQSAAAIAGRIIDDWFARSRVELEERWGIRFTDWVARVERDEEKERLTPAEQLKRVFDEWFESNHEDLDKLFDANPGDLVEAGPDIAQVLNFRLEEWRQRRGSQAGDEQVGVGDPARAQES